MNSWKKVTAITIAVGMLGTTAFAQKEKEKTTKSKSQEIIIRKSGDKSEKMTIVVDGENVIVNGKPISELNDAEITVLNGTDGRAFAPRARVATPPRPGQSFERMAPTRANRAMLGVVTTKADDGAKITEVTKESAAEKAGLKVDDVITKVGDKKIETSNDLIAAIGTHKPADNVDITYKRDGKETKATATLGENKVRTFSTYSFDGDFDFPNAMSPFGEGFSFNKTPKVGLQIMDVEEGTGVQIREVEDESAAAKAGLKEGDVVTSVNGKTIAGVDEMKAQIKDIKEGDVLKMTYRRGSNTQTVDVKIPKRLKTANL